MAVIKYSGLVDQLRGKLNGTVFSRFNAGFNSYKKGQPSRVGSQVQQRRRQQLSDVAQTWRSLSPSQRESWQQVAANTQVLNRLGEPVYLSAWNYFVKYNMLYLMQGQDYRLFVETDLLKPATGFIPSVALTISQSGTNFTIDDLSGVITTTTGSSGTTSFLFYISGPYNWGAATYDNTYWYVGTHTEVGPVAGASNFNFSFSNVLMPSGWLPLPATSYRIKVLPIYRSRAQESTVFYRRVEGDYIPEQPPVLDIEIIPNGSGEDVIVWFSSSGGIANVSSGYNLVRSTAPLAGTAADYWSEWVMSATFDPSPTPIPASVDTGRPIVQSQLMLIGSGSTPSLYLTPQFEWYDWINTNNPVPTSAQSRYYTFKARIIRKSDGAVSPWGYYTLLATGA